MKRATVVSQILTALFLVANLLAPPVRGQALPNEPLTPEGRTISSIVVEPQGGAAVDPQRVLANMSLREGQEYSSEAVQRDIKTLREKNVGDADILPELDGEGVRVTVYITASGLLGEVIFQGNSRLSDRELLKEVTAEVGAPLDESKVLEGRFGIEELYRDRGFSDVSASYSIETDPETGFSRVIYSVLEGETNKLRAIFFEGNTAIPEKELRGMMKTKNRGIWSRITGSNKVDSVILSEDKAIVERAFQNKGYMDARVTHHELRRIEEGSDFVDLIIHVRQGLLYTVSDIRLGGNTKFSNADLSPEVKMQPGQVYSAQAIQDDAQRVEDQYGRLGYADARVTPRITSVGGQQVRVTHSIREGEISYVRKINIAGMDYTKDEVIRRELAIEPGDVLNTVKLRQSQKILENTRFFAERGGVEISPEETSEPGHKDININVTEGKTGSFQVGVAFTSVENAFGYLSFNESNFDIGNWSRIPPRGAGQKFQFNLRWGTRTKDFLIGFTEPWFLGQRLALGGELYWRELLFLSDEYSQRMAGGAVWLRRPLNDTTRLQLEYRLQEVEIFDLDDNELIDRDGDGLRETFVRGVSPEIAAEEGEFLESKLSIELLQDTRDSNTLARTGHKLLLSGNVTGGFLGGDVDTYGLTAAFTQHVSLPLDTIFTFHSEVNVVDTWSSGDRVPIFNRLFLGGAYNLRGFRFRDVGPVDEEEEPLGGGTSAFVKMEYSFPIFERVRGSAFLDAGFVNSGSFDFSTTDLNVDAGLGVRIEVPGFGPMRLDYGVPVKRSPHQSSSGRINFLLDYSF